MRSVKNVERVLKRRSFPDFLSAMNHKVDVKEWSEVGGVLNVAMWILKHFDPHIIMDIGCGKRPTLATLMALNFNKMVWAIDPNLDIEYSKFIRRLHKSKTNLQLFIREKESLLSEYKRTRMKALVLANHSHSSKNDTEKLLSFFSSWVYVTIPCCVDNKLDNVKSIHYKDEYMHTDKNDIYIFSNDSSYLRDIFN